MHHRLLPRLFVTLPRLLLFLILIAAALTAGNARAGQIIMNNGDVISGKITRVDEREVIINPSYTKKFGVRLSEVASIVTDEPLEILMDDGSRFSAKFAGLDDERQLVELESETRAIDMAGMVKAAKPQPFYSRESLADALITINEGNTQSRSAIFNLDTRLRLGEHRQYAKLTVRRDENKGVSTKKQNLFRYEYDWLFRKRWYLGATVAYERDPIRDLSHRFTFGALLGFDILDAEHSFLTIKAGMGYTDEKLGSVPQSGPVGLWELDFHHDFLGGSVELFHDHALSYQHYGDNNIIVRSNTGLRLDIIWNIYATANYRFNYESEPAPGKFNKDSTLAFGLGSRF